MQSERLSYRLFEIDDVDKQSENIKKDIEEIWQIDQDPEVMRYLTGGKITSREDLHQIFLPRIRSYTNVGKGYGMWRVALKDTDECIGEIIARPMYFFSQAPHFHDIELGWRFTRKYWGKGYAYEAAKRIMDRLVQRQEVTQFTAIADTNNIASISIMKKLGMRFVEHRIHSDPLGETEVDVYRVCKSVFNT
uniref:GNAT family N-acetyltransferase n=1 Tax=Ningiella ruwaisensis TaxID=2364274 RepID=UPI00109F9CE4|nr:GNAT family N-acetyltransferase [Ningiella ruwaisensis]